jgi:outer membrane protein TolC
MSRTTLFLICVSVAVNASAPFDSRSGGLQAAESFAQGQAVRLTLADAIARGLATSHRIAEIKAREEGARAAAKGAELAKRPIVSASAGYSRTNHVDEFSVPQPNGSRLVVYPDIPDNFVTRVGFQWPIYTSGRTDALERAADAEVSAVSADIEAARADLRFEIVRAYWAAVTAREAVRVLEESAARAEAQLGDARQRFKVGLIPPNEVASLEAQRSREQAQYFEAANMRESALIDLRRLIGVPRDTVIELMDPLEPGAQGLSRRSSLDDSRAEADAQELIKSALESRPERKAMMLRLGGIEARQQAALTGTKPTINLAGGVDYANPNPRIFPRQGEWQESWDVGVNVNWNFFDFGRAKAQAAEASAAALAARERLAEFDTLVSADVQQRLLDLQTARAMVTAAGDGIRSASEARRVVADRFAAGVATSTDVLVAQVALLEAELARTRALASVRLAEARLERTLGSPTP